MKKCKHCGANGYIDARGSQYSICRECRSIKISKSNMGKKVSDETRRKSSESHKGQIPWIKGRHHSG